ncbi:MAG: hypothetical protein ACYTF8_18100, partial [Planctomycetota bacterium]
GLRSGLADPNGPRDGDQSKPRLLDGAAERTQPSIDISYYMIYILDFSYHADPFRIRDWQNASPS